MATDARGRMRHSMAGSIQTSYLFVTYRDKSTCLVESPYRIMKQWDYVTKSDETILSAEWVVVKTRIGHYQTTATGHYYRTFKSEAQS